MYVARRMLRAKDIHQISIYGTPPHSGIALGLDRMVMLFAGAKSLRDVIAFPKVASASDIMTDSPNVVAPEQLQELKLKSLA